MSEVVKKYYDQNAGDEWERLNHPYSRVEFESTMHLIGKYLPESGRVCDIGCGPGRYSIELLKRGYDVTLFELSQKELARLLPLRRPRRRAFKSYPMQGLRASYRE
jgi:S-adenosylmethionine-dependent methyltransferase